MLLLSFKAFSIVQKGRKTKQQLKVLLMDNVLFEGRLILGPDTSDNLILTVKQFIFNLFNSTSLLPFPVTLTS